MISRRKRIAVIGGGVTGLGAAWALRQTADVTLYDAADRFGGHAWTVDIEHQGMPLSVDIGFICFNRPNYPNFTALLNHLDVPTVMTRSAAAIFDSSPTNSATNSNPGRGFAPITSRAHPKPPAAPAPGIVDTGWSCWASTRNARFESNWSR